MHEDTRGASIQEGLHAVWEIFEPGKGQTQEHRQASKGPQGNNKWCRHASTPLFFALPST